LNILEPVFPFHGPNLFNPAKIAKDDRSAHSSGSAADLADVSLPTLEHGLVNFNKVFDGIKTGALTATDEIRPSNGSSGDCGDQQIAANSCNVHCSLLTLDNSGKFEFRSIS
jgi:hypothetical protein